MGLGIAQVRLLALTHRKSDIELEMSIDSKRKQQLTRKSTELAHDYYAKLNNYNYQYSTTGGFNDLDYNYLMGESNANGTFTKRFLNQILYGTGDVDTKIDNRVILTDSKGQVILNNDLVECVEAAAMYSYPNLYSDGSSPTVADKTAFAIWNFVQNNTSEQGYAALEKLFSGNIQDGYAGFAVDSTNNSIKRNAAINKIIEIIKMLMENGGVQQGGKVYIVNPDLETPNLRKELSVETLNATISQSFGGSYTGGALSFDGSNGDSDLVYLKDTTDSGAQVILSEIATINSECSNGNVYTDPVSGTKAFLKAGTCYTVENCVSSGSSIVSKATSVENWLWDGKQFIPNMRADMLQYLANIVDYLTPMLSAGLQNGYTGTVHLDNINVPGVDNYLNKRVAECNALFNYVNGLSQSEFETFREQISLDGASTHRGYIAARTQIGFGHLIWNDDGTDWVAGGTQQYYESYTYNSSTGKFEGFGAAHNTINAEYYAKYREGGSEALGVGEYRIVNVVYVDGVTQQLAYWNDGSGTLKSSVAGDQTFRNFLYLLDHKGKKPQRVFNFGGGISWIDSTPDGYSPDDISTWFNPTTTGSGGFYYTCLGNSCANALHGATSDRYKYNTATSIINSDYVTEDDRFVREAAANAFAQTGTPGVCTVAGKYYASLNGSLNGSDFIEISNAQYLSYINATTGNTAFDDVQTVSTLQDGLKSGVYQLCMVDNVNTGVYHKNTTMDYFIHRNLCVEKIDMSKREELTAWYNAEQAALSDQENYWDEEITNLSTELTAVKQEIDSVKSLKSNAIKSVFGWGGN